MKLKVAMAVHGRFHAFDLARELIRAGEDLTLLTNYPRRTVEKFGIPRERVLNYVAHGIASRVAYRLMGTRSKLFEAPLHRSFSRWAGRAVLRGHYDVVHSFSGISEELLMYQKLPGRRTLQTLVRGSAHIKVQARLLAEEAARAGARLDCPSEWMIQREQREYALADAVFVLSKFARDSFLEQGYPAAKLRLLPLGSELTVFRAEPKAIEERCARILSGKPLRVLTVGSFTFQKGSLDLAQIARTAGPEFHFQFVGDTPRETAALKSQISSRIEFRPRIPQRELPAVYQAADLFLFPTIQDGYAVVLAQAQANGLPILATPNCAAPDIVAEGKTGWVVPIRSPERMLERLRWCHEHRPEMAQMVRDAHRDFKSRDWSAVAGDFIAACAEMHGKKLGGKSPDPEN